MNETLKILKLLEQGKINAEEAERLLNALNMNYQSRRKKRQVWNMMGFIPEMISTTIADTFKYTRSEHTHQFPEKKKIVLRTISGDIKINGTDTKSIEVNGGIFARINERDEKLEIKAITGDIKIITPKKIDLEIKGVSGDIEISNINGKINLATISGDIEARKLRGSLNGELVSGDIILEYEEVGNLRIQNKNGDILLYLNNKSEASLNLYTENGTISCEFSLKDEVKTAQTLKGIINKPGATIELKSENGNISIKKLTKET